MNKQHVHQYVLEHITGSLKEREKAKRLLWVPFCVALVLSVLVLIAGLDVSSSVGLAVCTLLAGVPFGVLAQRNTLRIALSRESLRLKRFLIGKKGYVAPKDHVLHEQADLFSIAANLVCKEPFLSPQSNAAAWHTYSVLADVPGVGVNEGWYGKDTQASVFLYGDLRTLTEISSDIWDLGHVRKITDTDKTRFIETSKGWRRQKLISVALAYAPLLSSADPSNLTSIDIKENCVLLGALGLEGSRGYGQTMAINPAMSVKRSTSVQVVISLALLSLVALSLIGGKILSVTPPINMLLLLAVSVFMAPVLLAVYSWDTAGKNTRASVSYLVWNAGLIASCSYGLYVLYLYSQAASGAALGSVLHQTATAMTVLAFGLSVLAFAALDRFQKVLQFSMAAVNPLFLLAWSSSLLIILLISYGSGPLVTGGILMAIGGSLAYIAISELRTYAERHHTREHIIDLLKEV